MNSSQFLRHLVAQGIEVEPSKGKGGHLGLFNPANGRSTVMPKHGGGKQLGTGLMKSIEKQLGLRAR